MTVTAVRVIVAVASDKRVWKFVGGIFLVIVLLVVAVGTSCTAHNTQYYISTQVVSDFAPIIASINNELDEGEQINTPLLYAAYMTLFDNAQSQNKAEIRIKLSSCFCKETTKKVEATDSSGKPLLDDKGNKKYVEKKIVVAINDESLIFQLIEGIFQIKIDETHRQYIKSLAQSTTFYNSNYSLAGDVMAYHSLVEKFCNQYQIPGYTALILAVMQQESGGKGTDPMQCSESPYNEKYPRKPGAIDNAEYSIEVGTRYLASCLKAAQCKSPNDISGISLALQGYNFGNGYISWALGKGGYSRENAEAFSQMEAKQMNWSGYGDIDYVSHVLRYYNSVGGGNSTGVFMYPIKAGVYTITSSFENRADPFTGKATFHKGIDLAAPAETPIYACADGTVSYAQFGTAQYGGYGDIVVIQHSTSLVSMYGHCSKLLVSPGQAVHKGDEIALVGSTGESTGNHCHFEVRSNNKSVNPMLYLK